MVKNLRKNFLLGFGVGGGGGGGGPVAVGGAVWTLPLWGGGLRGAFDGRMVEPELGVAGVGWGAASFELDVSATRPGGAGSEVVALADPGSTAGFESAILGFLSSAYLLCSSR